MTTASDDFNRADSANINTGAPVTWTPLLGGTYSIASNQLKLALSGSPNSRLLRCETDLGSADHSAQVTVANYGTANAGPAARFDASASTCYLYTWRASGTAFTLFKCVAGTFTALATGGSTKANGDVLKIDVNGSTITCYRNGTVDITHTDTSITTGSRGGIFASDPSDVLFDDFSAAAASTDALTATDQASGRIFQRAAGGTTKDVPFSGTYTGTVPANIQVRILDYTTPTTVIQDWTTLSSATISGGNWSGTLSVPQGGWYKFEARSRDATPSVLAASSTSSNKWGVGVLVALIGQSNMRNMWSIRSTPPASDDLTRRHAGAGWFAVDLLRQTGETSSNQGLNNFGGNGSVRLANLLRAVLSVPIGLLEFAIGGTIISTWESGGTSFTNFSSSSAGVARSDVGSDFEFALWHQGETDAQDGTTDTGYKTSLDNVYSACRALTGRDTSTLKFGVAVLGNMDDASTTDAEADAIRQAQLEWIRDTTGAFFAGSSVDMVRTDTYHWTAPYYERMARRYAQAILKQLGEVTNGAEGPKIASASRTSGSADITLAITQNGGTAIEEADGATDGGSLTGFQVSDDDFATMLTISSTAFSSGSIVLTLSAAPADADTVKVRYQYGENPSITNVVYDDQTPQSDTLGFPLQPTIGSVAASLVAASVAYTQLERGVRGLNRGLVA